MFANVESGQNRLGTNKPTSTYINIVVSNLLKWHEEKVTPLCHFFILVNGSM